MRRFFTPRFLLIAILVFSTVIRFWRLDYPREYVFDEVYHAFTAKMYALDRYEAWVWWTSPPDGVAYEWTHPPLAKVIMSWGIDVLGGPGELPTKVSDSAMEASFTQEQRDAEKKMNKILANESYGWRVTGALFGVLCTYGLFLLGSHWFRNRWIGILAAFLFSVDLLPLVQSRTAMNDIYAVTFLVYGFYFFTQRVILLSSFLPLRYWLLAGVMVGCAIASKWTSLFALGIVGVYHLVTIVVTWINERRAHSRLWLVRGLELLGHGLKGLVFFAVLPFAIYLLSYWQLFTLPIHDYQGNDLAGDIVSGEVPQDERWFFMPVANWNSHFADRMYIWWGLQKQMWWYHTNLVAEHNFTSKWWSWPFMVRPVWFYVNYCGEDSSDPVCLNELARWQKDSLVGDVYTMGNPMMYWAFVPLMFVFVRRFLYEFRWWFASTIVFAVFILLKYNFTFAGYSEPISVMQQAQLVFENVFPPILLFSMLMLIFVSLIQAETWAVNKQEKELAEFLPLLLALLAFSAFWLPWARSPRIMFYYHFFPPMTFMYVFMAGMLYWIAQRSAEMRSYVRLYLFVLFTTFVYFYPHVTAFLLPEAIREQYWWFESWK